MYAYTIAGKLPFHFDRSPHLPDLISKLQHARIQEPAEGSVLIQCYGAAKALCDIPWKFYKGIPWKAAVIYDATGKIEKIQFHAVFFRQFLFYRIVLLPLLWRLAVQNGGFYLLGTVYRQYDTVSVLFAKPGAGKTRFMLTQLLNPACRLIGDGSLLYLPGNGFLPVINEIELRWKTIAELPWRQKLSVVQKGYLLICHLISAMTRRFISFNLTLPPEKLGITSENDSPDLTHCVLFVRKDGGLEAMDENEIRERIMNYLTEYHQHYFNIFDQEPPYKSTLDNIFTFCSAFIKKERNEA